MATSSDINTVTRVLVPSVCRQMQTVLLVEDNPDDVYFMQRACKASGTHNALYIVNDGQAAIDYLSGITHGNDPARYPLPDLIFLDINLPLRTGHEVLEWLRAQPGGRTVPVVMLTTSEDKADINRAYQLGANSYLLKSADPEQLAEKIEIVLVYWLEMNRRTK